MRIGYTQHALAAVKEAHPAVQKAFFKQVMFLAGNLHHPSLHAKKYNEAEDKWQARVNRDWRFYFKIIGDTYMILDVIPHPK